MLPRTPEPVAEDLELEAEIYREMDHSTVNGQFVRDLLDAGPVGPGVIDLGCGPAFIPILLCEATEGLRVMAVDSAVEMLEIAKFELEMAGRVEQIELQQIDLNEPDALHSEIADTVICNTVLHHLDNPVTAVHLALRALKPGGRLFIRDLFRPETEAEIEALVRQHVGPDSASGHSSSLDSAEGTLSPAQLLRQSLHAALTLDEIRELIASVGLSRDAVKMTSDRHWTIDWTKP